MANPDTTYSNSTYAQVSKLQTAKYYMTEFTQTAKTPVIVAVVITFITGYVVGSLAMSKHLKTKYTQEQLCPQNKP